MRNNLQGGSLKPIVQSNTGVGLESTVKGEESKRQRRRAENREQRGNAAG
jgi:hypothetical protein